MRRPAFTLIELLLVIGIIAILASIVIIAINPNKQLGSARDTQRRSDVGTILNAITQYMIDHNGSLPAGIPTGTAKAICATGAASCNNGVSLADLTNSGTYLVKIPVDPQVESGTGTNYTILQTAGRRITVSAPGTEGEETISVTR